MRDSTCRPVRSQISAAAAMLVRDWRISSEPGFPTDAAEAVHSSRENAVCLFTRWRHVDKRTVQLFGKKLTI